MVYYAITANNFLPAIPFLSLHNSLPSFFTKTFNLTLEFNISCFLQLIFFEEILPNMLEHQSELDLPLDEFLEERLDGDIFVFQKKLNGGKEYRLPTCKDYFNHLFYKVFVDQKTMNRKLCV